MPKRYSYTAVALVLLGLLMLAPAAQAADAKKGWFFSVEGASLTPGNVNTPIISTVPSDAALSGSPGPFSTDTEWMEFDSSIAFRGEVGYSFGEKGRLSVSYWNYSDDSDSSGFADFQYYDRYSFFGVGPGASFGYSFYYSQTWDFNQDIDAKAFDIEWKHDHSVSDDFTLTYGVGLRTAKFEDKVEGTYITDADGTPYTFPASRSVEGDGFGFTGSVGADYNFTDHFGIGTNLRVGFLKTDVDSESSITDLDGYYNYYAPGTPATWTESNSISDEVSNTVDFDFNLAFKVNEMISIDAGYVYTSWSDIATPTLGRASFGTDDQVGPNYPGENRDRISFSGPRIRVRFKFGS